MLGSLYPASQDLAAGFLRFENVGLEVPQRHLHSTLLVTQVSPEGPAWEEPARDPRGPTMEAPGQSKLSSPPSTSPLARNPTNFKSI